MYIHLDPVTYVGRGYDEEDGYEKRHPYKLVFNAFLFGDGEAFIYAMHGNVDLATYGEIAKQMQPLGVTKITAERNGRRLTFDVEKTIKRYDGR